MKDTYIRAVFKKPAPDRKEAILPVLDALSQSYPEFKITPINNYCTGFKGGRDVPVFTVSPGGVESPLVIPDLARYRMFRESGVSYQLGDNLVVLNLSGDTPQEMRIVYHGGFLWTKGTSTIELCASMPTPPYHEPVKPEVGHMVFESPEQFLGLLRSTEANIERIHQEERQKGQAENDQYQERVRTIEAQFDNLGKRLLGLGYTRVR